MSFQTRYSQPFTLAEAINLDVAIISEEITRLQESLRRLRETQSFLRQHLDSSDDKDEEIVKAVEENETTIASQEERVAMLKVALREKGVLYNAHYDLPATSGSRASNAVPPPVATAPGASSGLDENDTNDIDNGGGLHL